MKISKKVLASCDEKKLVEECDEIYGDQDLCDELGITEDSPKVRACDFIKSAIDSLAEVAKEDEQAKNSIADLSVVLLDLK